MNFGGTIRVNRVGICIITGVSILILIYLNTNNIFRSSEDVKGEPGKSSTHSINLRRLLIASIEVAERGGKEVVSVRNEPDIHEQSKGKTKEGVKDVFTKADFNSHCIMFYSIKHTFPELKVISEESFAESECPDVPLLDLDSKVNPELSTIVDYNIPVEDVTVWIDPLDATKEYTEKLLQYVTTMVCVAVKGKPIIGVIHKPFDNKPNTYWAWVDKGTSGLLKRVKQEDHIPKIIISRSHAGPANNISIFTKAFGEKNSQVIFAAGAGYKSLELVRGNADAYLHLTDIKKWDVCAGNAIISAMGGKMTTLSNTDIDYSYKSIVLNSDGLLGTMEKHKWFLDKFTNAMKEH